MTRETKRIGGVVTETKVKKVNGVEIGEISGYIAAWTIDEGFIPDRFVRGAFARSIDEHKARGNRQVRFKDHHGRTVGGFPIDTVFEDDRGLFGRAEVNLEVQQGREAFSLARQKVLVDFSVGFTARQKEMVNGVRVIHDADLNEGSIIDEPMNRDATVIEVKSMSLDLPIAPSDHQWDAEAADERIQLTTYREMKSLNPYVGDYLVADRVGDQVMLVPEAVQIAAEGLKGMDTPDANDVRLIERLLSRMSLPSPFDEVKRQFFSVDDVKAWGIREVEQAMVKSGAFSNGAAKLMVKQLAAGKKAAAGSAGADTSTASSDLSSLLESIREASNKLR